MSNSNLRIAQKKRNDEFYTLHSDVEKELCNYDPLLLGKSILCNCNDGEDSAFWLYFSQNFVRLGLKRLVAIKYGADSCGYVLEMERVNGVLVVNKRGLCGNGDFRSKESIAFLQQVDIVVTNPPFSLFSEYIPLLTKLNKKFLVIGNMNAMMYAKIFPLIRDNKLWLGYNGVKSFIQPNGEICNFGNILWFTNLMDTNSHQDLPLIQSYSPDLYPRVDNYDAINVGRVANIPKDYYGIMGVPISFLTKYNPKQFEIIGLTGVGRDFISVEPTKIYTGVLRHRENGDVVKSNKVNSSIVISYPEKPTEGVYYTADNAEGYLICLYSRFLIKRRESNNCQTAISVSQK